MPHQSHFSLPGCDYLGRVKRFADIVFTDVLREIRKNEVLRNYKLALEPKAFPLWTRTFGKL
jgi:hypothetical protein